MGTHAVSIPSEPPSRLLSRGGPWRAVTSHRHRWRSPDHAIHKRTARTVEGRLHVAAWTPTATARGPEDVAKHSCGVIHRVHRTKVRSTHTAAASHRWHVSEHQRGDSNGLRPGYVHGWQQLRHKGVV